MTHRILSVFNKHQIDIERLEVSTGVVFLRYFVNNVLQANELHDALLRNSGILQIEAIDSLPSERRANELFELFDRLDEPIALTRGTLEIVTSNPAFLKLMGQKYISLSDIFANRHVIDRFLQNESIAGVDIQLKNGKRVICNVTEYTSAHQNEQLYIWIFHTGELFQEKFRGTTQASHITFENVIHRSEQMKSLISMARKMSTTDSTILIRGESGTGKELIARCIHTASRRSDGPFQSINCAALPEPLIESELFGYEPGAFTGSRQNGKPGLIEQANQGTFFLDEIGDMPIHLQSKLLRVLETKTIRRLGGIQDIPVNVRFIAATHKPLEDMIQNQLFRLDLYYRLNVYAIQIPPLRYRSDDILPLFNYFLNAYAERFETSVPDISEWVRQQLLEYDWPGNVREMENLVERSMLISDSESPLTLDFGRPYHPNEQSTFSVETNYTEAFERFERAYFDYWAKTGLSTRDIAKQIHVTHTTVANKLRKYRLKSGL